MNLLPTQPSDPVLDPRVLSLPAGLQGNAGRDRGDSARGLSGDGNARTGDVDGRSGTDDGHGALPQGAGGPGRHARIRQGVHGQVAAGPRARRRLDWHRSAIWCTRKTASPSRLFPTDRYPEQGATANASLTPANCRSHFARPASLIPYRVLRYGSLDSVETRRSGKHHAGWALFPGRSDSVTVHRPGFQANPGRCHARVIRPSIRIPRPRPQPGRCASDPRRPHPRTGTACRPPRGGCMSCTTTGLVTGQEVCERGRLGVAVGIRGERKLDFRDVGIHDVSVCVGHPEFGNRGLVGKLPPAPR